MFFLVYAGHLKNTATVKSGAVNHLPEERYSLLNVFNSTSLCGVELYSCGFSYPSVNVGGR